MKYLNLMIIFTTFLCSGYTNFFISEKQNVNQYYGHITMKNFITGRAFLNKRNSDFSCSGIYFIRQMSPSQDNKPQQGAPYAKLKCSDDRIIELDWNMNNTVEASDQFGEKHSFLQVKKKEYKNYIKTNTINEKDSKL